MRHEHGEEREKPALGLGAEVDFDSPSAWLSFLEPCTFDHDIDIVHVLMHLFAPHRLLRLRRQSKYLLSFLAAPRRVPTATETRNTSTYHHGSVPGRYFRDGQYAAGYLTLTSSLP